MDQADARMTLRELLLSPVFWIAITVSLGGGWYASRSIGRALVYALVGPLFLFPAWFIVAVALSLLYRLIRHLAPRLVELAEILFSSMPEILQLTGHPATLVTMALYFLYCHSERGVSSLPPAANAAVRESSGKGCANPYRRNIPLP